MTNKHTYRSAFSLVELLVVLAILGVLTAIALPKFFTYIPKSEAPEALSNMDNIRNVIETCYARNKGNGQVCTRPTSLLGQQGNFYYQICGAAGPSSIVFAACDVVDGMHPAFSDNGYTVLASPTGIPYSDNIYVVRWSSPVTATPSFNCFSNGILAKTCP